MQASSERGPVETQLLAYVKRLERNYYDWRAVHLHLSRLRAHNRRDYQLRVAASEFDGLLRQFNSELFQLSNGDIVYVWHGGGFANVDPVVLRLRYLFSNDPLTIAAEGEADRNPEQVLEPGGSSDLPSPAKFCSWFELEREYDTFCFHLEECMETLQENGARATRSEEPLDPARLARIETSLATMDLSGLIRRQAVCALLPQASPQPLFAEIYIAIRELATLLVPGVDLTADAWLFQRLAESLDRRLLSCLAKHELGVPEGAISVNLRLATLLSPEFLKFHQEFRRQAAVPVIIELQLIDIYAELGAYLFIREFLRERGYLVCIDGLHYLHLPLIDRKRLGADLVKIIWTPDLLDGLNEDRHIELKAAIKRAGLDRVILCRCDTTDAIRWGQSFGIRLFQGHYVDSRLRSARPPAIAAARRALRGNSGR
jgi:EAL domain-containing protein (putative c-di-GMP-specific phosphodiesterase class I)